VDLAACVADRLRRVEAEIEEYLMQLRGIGGNARRSARCCAAAMSG
jgi:hypothetical protein